MFRNSEAAGFEIANIFERSEILRNRYHFKCKRTKLTYCTCLEGEKSFYFSGDRQLNSMYNDILHGQSTNIPALLKLLSEGSRMKDELRIRMLKSVEETVIREREEFNREFEKKQAEERKIRERLDELRKERILNRYKLVSLVYQSPNSNYNNNNDSNTVGVNVETANKLKCESSECLYKKGKRSRAKGEDSNREEVSMNTRARGKARMAEVIEESCDQYSEDGEEVNGEENEQVKEFFECNSCKKTYHSTCCHSEISLRVKHSFPWKCSECSSCTVCGENNKKNLQVLCNICSRPFHIACLNPKLSRVPKGIWICNDCNICSRCHNVIDFPISNGKICLDDIPEGFEFIDTKFGTRICINCDIVMNNNLDYNIKDMEWNNDLICNVCNEILSNRGNRICSLCRFAVHDNCFHKQICKLCLEQKS
ncbi:PHD domain protein [Cryptosporidium xiaoi]|uniref:PHD domain protein n=1 Tax=Cryptosporidium xiaoi TaxID=659607 RepID=A0AAV9XV71_9CRYT